MYFPPMLYTQSSKNYPTKNDPTSQTGLSKAVVLMIEPNLEEKEVY